MDNIFTELNLSPLKLLKKGKVRDVYDFGNELLFIASDRVSAFDYVLPQGIPNKGKVLTNLSLFWFEFLKDVIPNHLITADIQKFPKETKPFHDMLKNRSMLVKKTEVIPIECVVRGYIIGTGWKEYQKTGKICDIPLPKGLKLAQKLPEPIFTPSTKAETGHDENISHAEVVHKIGKELADFLQEKSLAIYQKAADFALKKGIIIADTKFEFGILDNKVILIDEVLTPDSSRFWPKEHYQVGVSPVSFDKQIIRDYLENSGWDKNPPIPNLPESIILKTAAEYLKIERLMTR